MQNTTGLAIFAAKPKHSAIVSAHGIRRNYNMYPPSPAMDQIAFGTTTFIACVYIEPMYGKLEGKVGYARTVKTLSALPSDKAPTIVASRNYPRKKHLPRSMLLSLRCPLSTVPLTLLFHLILDQLPTSIAPLKTTPMVPSQLEPVHLITASAMETSWPMQMPWAIFRSSKICH